MNRTKKITLLFAQLLCVCTLIYANESRQKPIVLPVAIEDMRGTTLPMFHGKKEFNSHYETIILLGNSDQNALTKVTLTDAGGESNPHQSYIIRELDSKDSKHKILVIYGADKEGTKKGERMFCSFLEAKGHWLLSKNTKGTVKNE
jgi:uncharacterized alpha/beta hydrolase family protein